MTFHLSNYVSSIKTGFKDLTKEEIEALIDTLRPWLVRVEETRKRYDADTITPDEKAQLPPGSQRRAAGYYLTPMTEREYAAAFCLYQQYAAMIAGHTADAYRAATERMARINMTLDDGLSESWELFLMTLSAFDPNRAALSTWLCTDLPSKVYHTFVKSASEEEELPELFEAENTYVGDVEEYLDFRQWGEDFTKNDPKLQAIWWALVGQPSDNL